MLIIVNKTKSKLNENRISTAGNQRRRQKNRQTHINFKKGHLSCGTRNRNRLKIMNSTQNAIKMKILSVSMFTIGTYKTISDRCSLQRIANM